MNVPDQEFTARELRLYATGEQYRIAEDRRDLLQRAVAEDGEIAAQVDFFRLMLDEDEDQTVSGSSNIYIGDRLTNETFRINDEWSGSLQDFPWDRGSPLLLGMQPLWSRRPFDNPLANSMGETYEAAEWCFFVPFVALADSEPELADEDGYVVDYTCKCPADGPNWILNTQNARDFYADLLAKLLTAAAVTHSYCQVVVGDGPLRIDHARLHSWSNAQNSQTFYNIRVPVCYEAANPHFFEHLLLLPDDLSMNYRVAFSSTKSMALRVWKSLEGE